MKFEELKLLPELLRALEYEGYTEPTPIQAKAIPVVLERRDLVGCAQTGTGKTAAFVIPILQLLKGEQTYHKGPRRIKALIVTPTRELATQIDDSIAAYNRFLHLQHTVIIGGIKQYSQERALRPGVDILVATPGRLLDLMNQKVVSIQHVKYFVLDEADQMLDMGFIHDVKKIVAQLPDKRQSLLFSATMPPDVSRLARNILSDPVNVAVSSGAAAAATVKQGVYFVDEPDKKALLVHVLGEESISSALVFSRTKHGANKLAKFLYKTGISAEAIHGNKSQNQRQNALNKFKKKQTRVLVATDVAARGIDIDELSHVINFNIPNVPKDYIHRIGRTGRAGATGSALSFCNGKEKAFLRDIQKLLGKTIPVVVNHPYHMKSANPPATAATGTQSIKRSHPARSFGNSNNGQGRRKRKWYGSPRPQQAAAGRNQY